MIAEKTILPAASPRACGGHAKSGWLSRPGEDDGSARGPFRWSSGRMLVFRPQEVLRGDIIPVQRLVSWRAFFYAFSFGSHHGSFDMDRSAVKRILLSTI